MVTLLMPTSDPTTLEPIDRTTETAEPVPSARLAFEVRNLSAWYGEKPAIKDVTLDIPSNAVTSIIGPSGCGKSTFIRCLNRMHEVVPRASVQGTVILLGENLYSETTDPATVRRRVGMVFQKSNPFPTMSIADNVIVGLRLNGVRNRGFLNERLEKSLRMAALWDEVKDDLHKPGTSLSGGVGSVWGTLVGIIFIGVIINGMTLLGVDIYPQYIVRGLLIFAAVLINRVQMTKTGGMA